MLVGSAFASILTAISMGIKMIWDKKQRDRSLNTEELGKRAEVRSVAFVELEKTIPGLGSLVDRWQKEASQSAQKVEELEKEHAARVAVLEKEQEEDRIEIRALRKVVDQLTSQLRVANARISELERGQE